ncbi:rRNA methyltransferase 3, mitochondrial [Pogona vitticeps]
MAALARVAGAPSLRRLLLRPPSAGWVSRRGARRLRRSPVRVLPSLAEQQQQQEASGGLPSAVPRPSLAASPAQKEAPRAGWKGDEEPELRYERAFGEDKRLSKVVTVAKSKSFRQKHGKILLEGRRLIADALAAGAVPQMIFFSVMEQLRQLPAEKLKRAKLIKVKFDDIKSWSDVVTPQGVIGIFSRPDFSKMVYPEVQQQHQLPLSLICDNIRDPGNLGTILRSAAGAGCSRVLLVKGCVDAWEPKVLRAGMGAHFRIPVICDLEWEAVPSYLLPETCVYVADTCQPVPEPEEELPPLPRSPAKASSHGWVSRPYNMKARLTQLDLGAVSESEEEEEEEEGIDLEVQCYYEPWVDFPVAVVIGGETYGVSREARELAYSRGGKQLHIPIVPHVNSLNSAMAASVLLFEAKRQLMEDPSLSTCFPSKSQLPP